MKCSHRKNRGNECAYEGCPRSYDRKGVQSLSLYEKAVGSCSYQRQDRYTPRMTETQKRVRLFWFCLWIEGALALGFIASFVVTIGAAHILGLIFMYTMIIIFSWVIFALELQKTKSGDIYYQYQQVKITKFGYIFSILTTIFITTFFSYVFYRGYFLQYTPSIFLAVLCWIPLVAMGLMKWKLDRSLFDRISRGIAIFCVSVIFLGMGFVSGMNRSTVMGKFLFDVTGTHVFIFMMAIFLMGFLIDWMKSKSKKS